MSRVVRRLLRSITFPFSVVRWSLNWWRVWKTFPIYPWIMGAQLFKQSDFRSAARYYQRGIERHPGHKAEYCARLDHAYCLYRIGDLTQAVAELEPLMAVANPLKDTFLLLAKVQQILGDLRGAVDTLNRALLVFPEDVQITLQYAHTLFAAKAAKEQLEECKGLLLAVRKQLSLTDSRMIAVDAALASFELKFGDHAKGEQMMIRVLASGAAPYDALLVRAELMLDEGMLVPARGLLTRAVTMGPTDPRPLVLLARSYLMQDDSFEPAYTVQLASEGCRLSAWQNPEAVSVLVDGYTALGDTNTAELFMEQLRFITSSREIDIDSIRDAGLQIQLLLTVKEQGRGPKP